MYTSQRTVDNKDRVRQVMLESNETVFLIRFQQKLDFLVFRLQATDVIIDCDVASKIDAASSV